MVFDRDEWAVNQQHAVISNNSTSIMHCLYTAEINIHIETVNLSNDDEASEGVYCAVLQQYQCYDNIIS